MQDKKKKEFIKILVLNGNLKKIVLTVLLLLITF